MKKKLISVLGLSFFVFLLPSLVSAVSAPTSLSPVNGAKNYNSPLTYLLWSKVPGASGYELRLKRGNDDFGAAVSITTNYQLASTAGATNDGGLYYWQVRATDAGGKSNWSQLFRFTTISIPGLAISTFPGTNNPSIYKNIPKDFSWRIDNKTVFSKITIYDADQNDGACKETSQISQIVKGARISSHILMSLPAAKYCWAIKNCGNAGCSAENVANKFVLKDSKLVPNLIFASTGLGGTIFYWEKFNDQVEATIKVATSSNLAGAVSKSGITNNYLITTPNDAIDTYINANREVNLYWQVGADGSWSAVKMFKPVYLAKPNLTYPANNVTEFIATSSTFKWGAVKDAAFYQLDIVGSPNKTVYSKTNSFKIPANFGLATKTSYTWKVKAYNDFTESIYSTSYTFTTR